MQSWVIGLIRPPLFTCSGAQKPINTHNGQKQPEDFGEILQAKA